MRYELAKGNGQLAGDISDIKHFLGFFLKRLFVASLILLLSIPAKAQDRSQCNEYGALGITFSSFGDNELIRFDNNLVGMPGYSGKYFYSLGITFLKPISKNLDIETGFEYSRHKFLVDPNLPPSMDRPNYPVYLDMFEVPLSIRVTFLHYFYVGGSVMLNIDLGSSNGADPQTGLGAGFFLGGRYDFNCRITAFASPYMKVNTLLPFVPNFDHQRLWVSGLRFGLLYKFSDLKN